MWCLVSCKPLWVLVFHRNNNKKAGVYCEGNGQIALKGSLIPGASVPSHKMLLGEGASTLSVLTCLWPWASCWTSLSLFPHLRYQEMGRRGPISNDSPQRMLTLFCSWKALGKSEESKTLVTDEPFSTSSVVSHCPPHPTVRSLQHWLACQTCCHDNELQITQMPAKILTQELLGQGLLVPFPDQTKGTVPQIL